MEVREISRELGGSEEELVRRGVKAYLEMETFPKHFHDGSNGNVQESYISDDWINELTGSLEETGIRLLGAGHL